MADDNGVETVAGAFGEMLLHLAPIPPGKTRLRITLVTGDLLDGTLVNVGQEWALVERSDGAEALIRFEAIAMVVVLS